ncbi:MAG: tetratricopeptide repeat protein [Myxococcales bacterium]|nr:tetratricopeptide repeat protein [Myxococcales bacterium]
MRGALPVLIATVVGVAVTAAAPAARAQKGDVSLDRGPSSELYIRKRPPAPEAPSLPPELQQMLTAAEGARDDKRTQAIALLREFLAGKPEGDTRAEGLFKLAELLWEEARRVYLENMDKFERRVEYCRTRRGGCKQAPTEPRIDLSESEQLYRTLLADHPDFRRTDLVLYLVGFASKEDDREDDALAMFQQVIDRFPDSPLYGDSWMMVAEHWFAAEKWPEARTAYANILDHPEAATYDLALFKAAWCDWKLGDIDKAVREFKEVLDLAVAAKRSGSASQRRRRADLGDEALDYLVIVFTEDRSISAKEVFAFLASIGGEQYSRDVLLKVADAYFGQAEYERSADTYRFLISLEPTALSAATWQRKIVENWIAALDDGKARDEMKALVDGYGPQSAWAKAQHGQDEALAKSLRATETLVRNTATNMHADAQAREKKTKKPDLAAYTATAEAYATYLSAFGVGKQADPHAAEVRFRRAEILLFKLDKFEEAGDEYLAVGKSAPVGEYHKDALKKAMAAYEKARPANTAGRKELLPVDRKFAEAMDLYATLFPADPELVGLIFKNGQLFYDYGDYDEAIKRFGLIVTKYPDDPNAGPAGDRILKALAQGKDYENIEEWARRLKKAKAFASADQQDRLDRLIVESIGKSGEKYGDAGKYEQAATFYLRIPNEFPKHKLAPQSMMNAGVMYEKAKRPEQAASVYLDLAERYKDSDQAPKAAWAAGQLYEKVAYFDRAAQAYEVIVERFPKSPDAPEALSSAGYLRQSLGQYDQAIAHYQVYAKRYKSRKDAAEVAFRIGVVYEEQADDGRADQAFRSFTTQFRGNKRVIEAHVRSGRASIRLGQLRRAGGELEAALKLYKKLKGKDRDPQTTWAAEARYWQGELLYRDYEKVSLDVKPSALDRTLKKKTDLLIKAQQVYADVVEYGDLQWGTAALYRIGQIFDVFAEALRAAPTPNGLTEAEAESYRGALDMYVVDIEEKAIDLYSQGYAKAIELQVYDQYTTKIREALGRLSPDEYPPEREARARERIGDRPLEVKLVREVNR